VTRTGHENSNDHFPTGPGACRGTSATQDDKLLPNYRNTTH
jgi:hypothetical protein